MPVDTRELYSFYPYLDGSSCDLQVPTSGQRDNDMGLQKYLCCNILDIIFENDCARGNSLKQVDCHRLKPSQHRKNLAFTLSETLITLVIVGVVAAITVPSLIVKYQREQTVVKLKKVYSTMTQAAQQSVARNGNMNTWEYCNKWPITNDERANCFKTYFAPYLNIIKKCYYGSGTSAKECWYGNTNWFQNISGSGGYCSDSAVVLSDGTLVGISCNAGWFYFVVDINGRSKPNKLGKDVFIIRPEVARNRVTFWYYEKSVEKLVNPADFDSNGGACYKGSKRYDGEACGALLLKSGWVMPDNYPM